MIAGDEEETVEEARVSGTLLQHQVLVGINPAFFLLSTYLRLDRKALGPGLDEHF